MRKFTSAIFLFCILYSLFSSHIALATSLSVTPQIARIDLSSQAPDTTFVYKNGTKETTELALSLKDLKQLDEGGTPSFLDPKGDETYKYGLASWAKLSTNTLIIAPGEERSVKVYIDKTRLTQGGHYAAILAQIKQPGSGQKKVKLNAVFAALIFVRAGSEYNREEAKIVSIGVERDFFSFPKRLILRFENTGNVDITPHGLATVNDVFGKTRATGIINENSLISLPETVRRYNITLERKSAFLFPGIYRAHLNLRFGSPGKTLEGDVSFFSLGALNGKVIALLIVLAASFALIRKFKRRDKVLEPRIEHPGV